MSGIFGVVSGKDCIRDLFLGTFYLQHRTQDYCGIAFNDNKALECYTHKGLLRQQFPKEALREMEGVMGIGSVSSERQPVSELSKSGAIILAFVGNIINYLD